ncbi:hypothetical protein [Silvimonas iriomotensis]|uniref:Hemoglobin n=1 Tax=Silvimonas iriomotensis TaxID=449662 RepID=A0ABQ2PCD5_9NEIS|nr:hypothetical protein [Silvimonas iriomotensis]GGP22891.1 hypothetical protein GCM10010970_28910 [Silvimonas iriomotensis]
MNALASMIGIPAIKAVVDDFLSLLRQHPRFSASFNQIADEGRLKTRLVHFWHAVLDGETWRLSLTRSNGGAQMPAIFADSHGLVFQLFRAAISRCLHNDLATAWLRRVDILEQSFPQLLAPAMVAEPEPILAVTRCRQLN